MNGQISSPNSQIPNFGDQLGSWGSGVGILAEGLWTRLRNFIGALDRVDRLETSSGFDGWLQQLAGDETALAATMREFSLRALRLASEPMNYALLVQLKTTGALNVKDLLATTQLSRVEFVERLNGLSRAGLTTQSLESEQVEVTPLTSGLLSLVDEIVRQMWAQAQNDYLINPGARMPKPPVNPRRVNLKSEI